MKQKLKEIIEYWTTQEGKEFVISLTAFGLACAALGAGITILVLT